MPLISYPKILRVQTIALSVLHEIRSYIRIGRTEAQIAERCRFLLAQHGITETWYHDVPALVLVGARTTLSVSGKDYQPTEETVKATDLVTIDLSPKLEGVWGDCARSFVLQEGEVVSFKKLPEWAAGVKTQKYLHATLHEIAVPEMPMEELHRQMNRIIDALDYENLDFMGNLGHSIEMHCDDRHYIENGNNMPLGECGYFTFEPHIRKKSTANKESQWGFKMENIYCFYNGELIALGPEKLLQLP